LWTLAKTERVKSNHAKTPECVKIYLRKTTERHAHGLAWD
jgi:hypothetical protein